MDQETNTIKHHIDSERGRLAENLEAVESRVKEATDLRSRYRENPLLFAGAAFVGGMLLSQVAGKRKESHYATAETSDTSRRVRDLTDRLDAMFGALVGVLANKAQEFVSESVPGFKDEYRRTQEKKQREAASSNLSGGIGANFGEERRVSG